MSTITNMEERRIETSADYARFADDMLYKSVRERDIPKLAIADLPATIYYTLLNEPTTSWRSIDYVIVRQPETTAAPAWDLLPCGGG